MLGKTVLTKVPVLQKGDMVLDVEADVKIPRTTNKIGAKWVKQANQ